MIYAYQCEKCGIEIDENFPMGTAPKSIQCKCGETAHRLFVNAGVVFKGPGDHWPSQQLKRKAQMTKNNEAAGQRGYEDWKKRSPKLVEQ